MLPWDDPRVIRRDDTALSTAELRPLRAEFLGDRRLGGLHLRAGGGLWRWDGARGGLVEP